MATYNLGRVTPNFIGEWNNKREYQILDVVSYNGSSYICGSTNKNVEPTTQGYYWTLLAKSADTDYIDEALDVLQEQITINSQDIANAESKVNKLSTDLSDMDEWLNEEFALIDDNIKDNKNKIENTQKTVDANTTNIESLSSNIGIVQNNINSLSNQISTLQENLENAGIPYKGIINISSSSAKSNIDKIANTLDVNDVALCFIGDAVGMIPSTSKYITVHADLLQSLNYFFTTDSLDVNVGDILIIAKVSYLGFTRTMLKVIPLNDAKTNTVGLMTPWDKVRVNKVDGIEATANSALQLPTYGESNMNNAIWSGVYPWCTTGRPANSTGAYTCFVTRSNNADWSGYYTIEQTAYGREGELGQVYKRIIFLKSNVNDSPNWGEWIKITPNSTGEIERKLNDFERNLNDIQSTCDVITPIVQQQNIINTLISKNYNNYITNAGDKVELYEYFMGNNGIVYLPNIDTSKVISMFSTFNSCKNLIYTPILKTENVTSWNACFYNCESLTVIEELDFLNATSTTNMFYGCTSLDVCYIKHIGNKEECNLIDFSHTKWGFGGMYSADSVVSTLLTNSTDRKYFGYGNCEIKLPARTMYTCLTEEQRTQIQNKGYTLTAVEL